MEKHKFALEDRVALNMSGEEGIVVGRAEYTNQINQYFIRYVAADGRQIEEWKTEDALVLA